MEIKTKNKFPFFVTVFVNSMAVKIAPYAAAFVFEDSNKSILRMRYEHKLWKKNEGETLSIEPDTKVLNLCIKNKISIFSVLQSVLLGIFFLFLVLKKPWSFPLLLIPLYIFYLPIPK